MSKRTLLSLEGESNHILFLYIDNSITSKGLDIHRQVKRNDSRPKRCSFLSFLFT